MLMAFLIIIPDLLQMNKIRPYVLQSMTETLLINSLG